MADFNVNRIGAINAGTDKTAIFLRVFSGEVLVAFDNATVTQGRHQIKSISSGKSAQFIRTGLIGAHYHTPGVELVGQAINQADITITIDDLLVSDVTIANIDEAMSQFDARSVYSKEIGRALAKQMDSHVLQTNILAARSANAVTGLPGGSIIGPATSGAPASADFRTNGLHIAAAAFMAQQVMDEKNIPEEGRFWYIRPAQYVQLAQNTNAINQFYGGSGAYKDGTVLRVAGFEVVKTNQLPNSVIANGTVQAGTGNRYAGDFSKTVGLFTTDSAVATLKLLDLGLETEYSVARQGTLLVAKYAMGHGVLAPEAAIELVYA